MGKRTGQIVSEHAEALRLLRVIVAAQREFFDRNESGSHDEFQRAADKFHGAVDDAEAWLDIIAEEMTLREFISDRENVVAHVVTAGFPAGYFTLPGHPVDEFAELCGLLDLDGKVDAAGAWKWDGRRSTLAAGSAIVGLTAAVDEKHWRELDAEERQTA